MLWITVEVNMYVLPEYAPIRPFVVALSQIIYKGSGLDDFTVIVVVVGHDTISCDAANNAKRSALRNKLPFLYDVCVEMLSISHDVDIALFAVSLGFISKYWGIIFSIPSSLHFLKSLSITRTCTKRPSAMNHPFRQ